MVRYAGIKNGNIYIVADHPFINEHLQTVEIPTDIEHLSMPTLISHFRIKDGQFICKASKKSASCLKVALVSNWQMRCGISTYASNLFPELIKHIKDFKLFVEENEYPTAPLNQIGDTTFPDDKVVICWKRGEPLNKLANEIKSYDPDIVLIQHEWGLFPNARYWLSLMQQLSDYRVIVVLHSVFYHRDKLICEAALPEIIVHLEGAKHLLVDEKQVAGKVYVIPHGCYPCVSTERLWNFYKTDHSVIQTGFGFRYKGWEQTIKAIALLKPKYPDIFFTGIFSESPFNEAEHQIYYGELCSLIDELGVNESVFFLRGFQSDEVIDAYYRTNQVAVFPYGSMPGHEVFGASGAARLAMSKALPVITSSIAHFSDLPTIKADTPEEIADALDRLFSDVQTKQEQVNRQLAYIEANNWARTAERYIAVFEGT